MKTLCSVLVACLLGSASAALEKNVDYFHGRSANVIVQNENTVSENTRLLLKGDALKSTTFSELKDTHFADLFSHVMSLPAFDSTTSRSGFPKDSLFNTPKAAVIITLDSVGADTIGQFPRLVEGSVQAEIHTKSYPVSTTTLLTNMATGVSPSSHGIVGKSWVSSGQKVEAYVSENGQALAANIADIFVQQYNGASLIVTASADKSLASIFAPHKELKEQVPAWNVHTVSYDSKNGFVDAASTFSVPNQPIIGRERETGFDFNAKEEQALFAEAYFVSTLGNNIRAVPASSDSTPDLFAITFSSLKGISTKYGASSAQYQAAIEMAHSAISVLLESLNESYSSSVAAAIVFADTTVAVDSSVKDKVINSGLAAQDIDAHYPAIYTNDAVSCQSAKSTLRDVHVKCATTSARSARYVAPLHSGIGNSTKTKNTDAGTPDYIAVFWIIFFFVIIFLTFILWGVYNLCFVGGDASKDSLLFRVSGRHLHQS